MPQVSIALSLLLSELAAPPFDQLICTFSANPQLHRVTGDTLAERVRAVPCPNVFILLQRRFSILQAVDRKAVRACKPNRSTRPVGSKAALVYAHDLIVRDVSTACK